MRDVHLGEAAQLAPCDELARALCVTSHHGLTCTAWPCDYHRRRAAEAWGEIVRARRSRSGPGKPSPRDVARLMALLDELADRLDQPSESTGSRQRNAAMWLLAHGVRLEPEPEDNGPRHPLSAERP